MFLLHLTIWSTVVHLFLRHWQTTGKISTLADKEEEDEQIQDLHCNCGMFAIVYFTTFLEPTAQLKLGIITYYQDGPASPAWCVFGSTGFLSQKESNLNCASSVYKCLPDAAPAYLSEFCVPLSSQAGRSQLCSAAAGDLLDSVYQNCYNLRPWFFRSGSCCLEQSSNGP